MFDVSTYVDRAFNKVLKELIFIMDESDEPDPSKRTLFISGELFMFFERASYIYSIQAEMTDDKILAADFSKISELFWKISDNFAEMENEKIGIFLRIYDVETSTDVFGCIESAKVI